MASSSLPASQAGRRLIRLRSMSEVSASGNERHGTRPRRPMRAPLPALCRRAAAAQLCRAPVGPTGLPAASSLRVSSYRLQLPALWRARPSTRRWRTPAALPGRPPYSARYALGLARQSDRAAPATRSPPPAADDAVRTGARVALSALLQGLTTNQSWPTSRRC